VHRTEKVNLGVCVEGFGCPYAAFQLYTRHLETMAGFGKGRAPKLGVDRKFLW
jgi:hypothetical protein